MPSDWQQHIIFHFVCSAPGAQADSSLYGTAGSWVLQGLKHSRGLVMETSLPFWFVFFFLSVCF